MNKDRRKQIAEIAKRIENLRDEFDGIMSDLDEVRDDEQTYYDEMPENFQQADRGVTAEEAVSNLEQAHSALEEFDIDTIVGYLEEAQA